MIFTKLNLKMFILFSAVLQENELLLHVLGWLPSINQLLFYSSLVVEGPVLLCSDNYPMEWPCCLHCIHSRVEANQNSQNIENTAQDTAMMLKLDSKSHSFICICVLLAEKITANQKLLIFYYCPWGTGQATKISNYITKSLSLLIQQLQKFQV